MKEPSIVVHKGVFWIDESKGDGIVHVHFRGSWPDVVEALYGVVDEIRYNRALSTMPYNEYLHTEEWKTKRQEALERADERCQVCNNHEGLDVHHRTYDRRGHEKAGDLTVLCRKCHGIFHNEGRLHPNPPDEE